MNQKLKTIIVKLEKKLLKKFPNPPGEHDIYHARRVLGLALKLQSKHGGDKFIIAPGALLHDVHRLMRAPGKKYISPKESLKVVKKLLTGVGLNQEQINRILYCIEHHEYYSFSKNGKKDFEIETQIIQDADNLDALGAIGIARTFYWGGVHKGPIWLPGTNLKGKRHYDEEDETDKSQVEHFYSKILKLKNSFNTKTAQRMALRRDKFLRLYLKEFFLEWENKI